jgi:hypothetical protein
MPTVVEIIVPQLPVPAQPVVCLCNNKNKKKCRKKNMCRSSQPVVCLCNNKNKNKCRKKNMCRSSQPVVCL